MKRTLPLAAALALVAGIATANTRGAEFIQQWDADGDGRVTLVEAEERRASIFEMFDQDGDGIFSAAEFALIDEHRALEAEAGHGPGNGKGHHAMGGGRGHGRGMQGGADFAQPAAEGMKRFDADGDGVIVRAEFLAGTADWFAMRDRNGDGVITAADFGR
ncbi:calcium-binding protein [Ostreiculturibacter nitratireducens]|uniref:calcium-binding protein n=1 Tax=Ostreiculturibacter nitratireducens TaxID=3075226 RepID=UPI0031B64422